MIDFIIHKKPVTKETFVSIGKINDKSLMNLFKKEIDKGVKNNHNNYKTNVYGEMTSFKFFNNRDSFKLLIKKLKPFINKLTNQTIEVTDSWGNILNKGDFVHEHDHIPNYISGIVYLTEGEGTYFSEHDLYVKAEVGKFVLFDSVLKHKVNKSDINKKRYSLAFNFTTLPGYVGEN